jgi:hypothetical protein
MKKYELVRESKKEGEKESEKEESMRKYEKV